MIGNITPEQTYDFSFVGIEELFVNGKVNIYPNPADSELNISFDAKDNTNFDVSFTDISGRVIMRDMYSVTQGVNKISLNLVGISQGIYFLNISEDDSSLRYKIIVK